MCFQNWLGAEYGAATMPAVENYERQGNENCATIVVVRRDSETCSSSQWTSTILRLSQLLCLRSLRNFTVFIARGYRKCVNNGVYLRGPFVTLPELWSKRFAGHWCPMQLAGINWQTDTHEFYCSTIRINIFDFMSTDTGEAIKNK